MQRKNELIKEITHANVRILFEFYNRMKGVIYNRYNKSKGFQFAMLEKNLNELVALMEMSNKVISKEFQRKERPEKNP